MSIPRISQPQGVSFCPIAEQSIKSEGNSFFDKVADIFQRYIVNNKYLNEVIHYVFVGMGFALGALFVVWTGKDVLRDVFQHCIRA